MKIRVEVDCMKYSAWFTYYCVVCNTRLDEIDDNKLQHPSGFTKGIFKRKVIVIDCKHVGKVIDNKFNMFESE